jgi:hypothetical protein
MITRNRIKFSEKQAAQMWQQVAGKELPSTEDGAVRVIYPGRLSGDSGPDFRDVVVANRFHLTKGDVEVHVRSSDWYNHEHHTDSAYNNVILHVALWHDCNSPTLLQSGRPIPLICLAKALRHQAYLLPYRLPCFGIRDHVDWSTLQRVLNAAGEERFKQKATHFQAQILGPELRPLSAREAGGQVIYQGMMRALGYARNTDPFQELADRVPLAVIESKRGLTARQALLLGTAGLLPSQRLRGQFASGEEVGELERMWQSASGKAKSMTESDWRLSHVYPNNSPVRRIVAQSYLLERYCRGKLLARILRLVKEAAAPNGWHELENGLTVAGDGYWLEHFDFDVRSKTKASALLANSKAGEIAVNVVLPFAFCWGEFAGDARLTQKAMELYNTYPRLAENCLTRHMIDQLCLKGPPGLNACHQQGLIHIFRSYCREGRCEQCPLIRLTGSRHSDKSLETGYHMDGSCAL